ncbi:class I adenylate-forming enzyme family protein [Amycolatopsis jejuensis]|uniref:class I adenylate-forming enzyme family protein n=1 Tax=Amycolatopsis jejuensis TaxID=330084 RepID=UPI000525B493|nr:class I adenylate-forming enzyme family protein [Amycolatopsis jejuensis]
MNSPATSIPHSPATIEQALSSWATAAPDRPALRCEDEAWTFRQLEHAVDRVAGALVADGISAGDRIALAGANSTSWVIVYLAALRAGAVIAPTSNRISPRQFRDQCTTLDAAMAVHDEAHRALVSEVDSRIPVREMHSLVRTALDRAAPVPPNRRPAGSDLALISFTSGSTGAPKGAVLTHDALLMGSAVTVDLVGTTPEDSTLVLVPLFHNTGFADQLGHMLLAGGCTHLLPRYRTAAAVEELSRRPVTYLVGVPSILRMLMLADDADRVFSRARTAFFGGSPMPGAWSSELLRRWPQVRLIHAYGLTEFTSACTALPPDLIVGCGDSVGLPLPEVRMKIVDDLGREVPAGTAGEVWVAGPTRMREYWRRPDLTAQKTAGEWLRTGDVGQVDDAGLLWLSGRTDDVINRGGEKILPATVESRLAELSAVAEAVVFGAPDPVLQARVVASVRLRPGAVFDEALARAHLAAALADYAVPGEWVLSEEEFPRTPSGKTDRAEVRARYLAALPEPGS